MWWYHVLLLCGKQMRRDAFKVLSCCDQTLFVVWGECSEEGLKGKCVNRIQLFYCREPKWSPYVVEINKKRSIVVLMVLHGVCELFHSHNMHS